MMSVVQPGGVGVVNMELSVCYGDLVHEVRRFLGYSPDESMDLGDEQEEVDEIIRAAVRSVYWPQASEGGTGHRWSFLCPEESLEIVPDQHIYNLPDDFVRMVAPFTHSINAAGGVLQRTAEAKIRALLSREELKQRPKYFSIRARDVEVGGYEVVFYPIPDEAETLTYRYERQPQTINDHNPCPLGGAAHGELFISACLMIADKRLNYETLPPDGGQHARRFREQLAASIELDRQVQAMGDIA